MVEEDAMRPDQTRPNEPPQTAPSIAVTARLDPHLSRWLWLVKWLLALPHYLVLAGLWVAVLLSSVVALFAILVTGRYPRPLFGFTTGVLRWSWRVGYYSYSALGTDRYPPFSLADDPDYPARLVVRYPEQLSRGLVLVKWWLLAIPHYLVLAVFFGGAVVSSQDDRAADGGPGLLGVLVLIAAVALLFTGRYPRGLWDLVVGVDRWALRVAAYVLLLTDDYPPFRLDQGGGTAPEGETVEPHAAPAAAVGPRGGARTAALVIGALLLVPALGLLATGSAALVADRVLRDDDGYLTGGSIELQTSTAALASDPVDIRLDGPDWAYLDDLLGDVRLTVEPYESGVPLFVGVGPDDQVAPYLDGFAHDVVVELHDDDDSELRRRGAGDPVEPPESVGAWSTTDTGSGQLAVSLPVSEGSWTAVVMRADGSPGVHVRARAGATLPDLDVLAAGLLAGGLALLVAGTVLIAVGASRGPG